MCGKIHLIGVPTSAGAYAPGQERAPQAFRRHGLVAALEAAGLATSDLGDVDGFRWRPDPANPAAANMDEVRRICLALADRVADALADDCRLLILGGDCTIALGVVAGALRTSPSVGLIYVDRDADLNPPRDSDGALDWTGVAHLLAIDGSAPDLSGIGPRHPMLQPADILYFGLDNLERNELQSIERLGLKVIRRTAVEADPGGAARAVSDWALRYDIVLVHLDVDVLDFVDFHVAENVRRDPGLSFDALGAALGTLLRAPNVAALTVTEANPDHAPNEADIFGRFNCMLARALSG